MDLTSSVDKRYLTITWGLILLWIGSLSLVPGDQSGLGVLGIGLIFLGLNLARALSQIPVNAFSITLGALGALLGAVVLLQPVLGLGFRLEMSLFPFLLIAIGLYLLIPGPNRLDTT